MSRLTRDDFYNISTHLTEYNDLVSLGQLNSTSRNSRYERYDYRIEELRNQARNEAKRFLRDILYSMIGHVTFYWSRYDDGTERYPSITKFNYRDKVDMAKEIIDSEIEDNISIMLGLNISLSEHIQYKDDPDKIFFDRPIKGFNVTRVGQAISVHIIPGQFIENVTRAMLVRNPPKYTKTWSYT